MLDIQAENLDKSLANRFATEVRLAEFFPTEFRLIFGEISANVTNK